MIGILANVLLAGLQIWQIKEKRKWVEEVIKIKETLESEWDEPIGKRNQALIDRLERKLLIIANEFIKHSKDDRQDFIT